MRFFSAIVAFALAFLPGSLLHADITWTVTFNDVVNNTNVGFDDPGLGAVRQATVLSVFDYINTVVDENGAAEFRFNNSQTDGNGALASAGPFFFSTPGFTNGFLFDHATTGDDPFPDFPDATSTVDFGYNWNSDLSNPAGNQFDLFTVLLHEVTHAMGFLSLLQSNGSSGIGANVYSVYDSFLERVDGTQLFPNGPTFEGVPGDLTSGSIFFDGPGARAGNNGNRVEVYAPNPFNGGSSISHLDPGAHSTSVMNPAIAPGVSKRIYSSQDLGVLSDIGWTLHAVPEPGTMAIWGILGSSVFWARHRKRRRGRHEEATAA